MKQSSRQQQAVSNLKAIDASNDFFFDEKTWVAKFIKGKLSKPSNNQAETIARTFLKDNAGLLDLQEGLNESLEVLHIEKDKQGFISTPQEKLLPIRITGLRHLMFPLNPGSRSRMPLKPF